MAAHNIEIKNTNSWERKEKNDPKNIEPPFSVGVSLIYIRRAVHVKG